MIGIQFDRYFAKTEETDKETFIETLTVEVKEKDKNAILEAAKREADSQPAPPPEVYKNDNVAGKGKRKRAPKTWNVFGE